MITVRFFAQYRERLGCETLQVEDSQVQTIADLLEQLQKRGENWQAVLSQKNLLIAKNQEHSRLDSPLSDGDEIAFFPPVSGG